MTDVIRSLAHSLTLSNGKKDTSGTGNRRTMTALRSAPVRGFGGRLLLAGDSVSEPTDIYTKKKLVFSVDIFGLSPTQGLLLDHEAIT